MNGWTGFLIATLTAVAISVLGHTAVTTYRTTERVSRLEAQFEEILRRLDDISHRLHSAH